MLRFRLAAMLMLSTGIAACAIEDLDRGGPGGDRDGDDGAAAAGRDSALAQLAPTLTEVTGFGSNPGALKMYRYAPAGLPAGRPLVVALHGCTQTALVYATHTEWNTLADRFGFSVVYAEQQRANNISSCFSWFQPSDASRGQGEALSIKQMVDAMKQSHGVDPARVFVTGLSAGGFMTATMMATYPDVFAGGAINAGGAHGCATSVINASACQNGNVSKTPQQWGDLVRSASGGHAGPWPRLIAFHGATDTTVVPADMQQAVDQWSNVLGIDRTPEVNETFRTATRKVYRDGSGRDLIETFLIASTGHALIVDPGTGVDQGGATGAFSEDRNIYSSYYIARFWGLLQSGPPPGDDTTPPQVSLTAPAAGATLTGTISATMDASDNVGVTRVELLVDGVVAGSDTTAPYAVALDTRTLSNGSHVLGARAFDAAGNSATAATRAVTVQNSGGGGATLETFSTGGGADQAGWSFGGWSTTTAKDATGTSGSRSLTATATASFGTTTHTATWSGVVLGAAPRLSYQRQLSLSDANIMASCGFSLILNDGADHVIDARSISGLTSYSEASWTARANLDLSAYAGKTVTLKLVVTASDLASNVTRATAWIDQIQLQ